MRFKWKFYEETGKGSLKDIDSAGKGLPLSSLLSPIFSLDVDDAAEAPEAMSKQ